MIRRRLYHWLKSGSFVTMIAVGVILAVIGPFGTYDEMPFLMRLLYWCILVVGVGSCIMLGISYCVEREILPSFGAVGSAFLGTILGAVPGTALVIATHTLMRESDLVFTFARVVQLWVEVSVLGCGISLAETARIQGFEIFAAAKVDAGQAAQLAPGSDNPSEPEGAVSPRTKMHDHLPYSAVPDVIISVTMQDHYVAVTTARGTHLLLMRFSDAILNLSGIPGLRIHRSHWAALEHMHCLTRDGHRMWVKLSDGRRLPVSQTYLADVRAALEKKPNAL